MKLTKWRSGELDSSHCAQHRLLCTEMGVLRYLLHSLTFLHSFNLLLTLNDIFLLSLASN